MAKSSVLYAAAKEIGANCDAENRAFLACKARDEDPGACLESGGRVQDCALGILKSAMQNCGEALSSYAACLDRQSSQEYMYDRCRTEESVFRECQGKKSS
jgi:NADH dehydrogenase (ubiquinone) 1 alpha subcomplex subunit 8